MSFADISQYLSFPIPDPHNAPRPASKQQRLEMIIRNLKTHHAQVRRQIVRGMIQERSDLTSMHPSTDIDGGDAHGDETKMDIDAPMPDAMNLTEQQKDHRAREQQHLLDNLNAAWDPASGDPCVRPGAQPISGSAAAAAAVPPSQAPKEVQLAKRILDQLDWYDRLAKQTLDYYVNALEREKGRAVLPGDERPSGRRAVSFA